MPVWWGKNQSGMQAREELSISEKLEAQRKWLMARNLAANTAQEMAKLGVHKQIVNRLIEPWMWITTIVSATEWDNFFYLRDHEDAQPELRRIAVLAREQIESSKPSLVAEGNWHLPLLRPDDFDGDLSLLSLRMVSVGRCARVSYLTHQGIRDPKADIELHDRLVESGHWSPFEHIARADPKEYIRSNFVGWTQYRKLFPNENHAKSKSEDTEYATR